MKKFIPLMLLSGAALAQEAPFGLPKNTTIQRLEQLGAEDVDDGNYLLSRAPQSNRAFEFYVAKASPTHGVCQLTAYGLDLNKDAKGTKVREQMNTLRSAMAAKYGPPSESHDALDKDSVWTEADEFAAGLADDERTLDAIWNKPNAAMQKLGLQKITLEAAASDESTTFVVVTYQYINFDKCINEIRGPVNRGL